MKEKAIQNLGSFNLQKNVNERSRTMISDDKQSLVMHNDNKATKAVDLVKYNNIGYNL